MEERRWEGLHRLTKASTREHNAAPQDVQAEQTESELCCFCSFSSHNATFLEEEGGGAPGGRMGLPLRPQVVLFKTAKITATLPTQYCPMQGPVLYKHWQWGQILGRKSKDRAHVCTHVYTSLHLYVLYGHIYILMKMYSAKWFGNNLTGYQKRNG